MNFYDFYTDALEKVAKNVPTSPEKWARAKAMARAKFDVYPSAYANGWAAKKYKEMGGGWKKAEGGSKKKKATKKKSSSHKKEANFQHDFPANEYGQAAAAQAIRGKSEAQKKRDRRNMALAVGLPLAAVAGTELAMRMRKKAALKHDFPLNIGGTRLPKGGYDLSRYNITAPPEPNLIVPALAGVTGLAAGALYRHHKNKKKAKAAAEAAAQQPNTQEGVKKEAYLNAVVPVVKGLFGAGRALLATKKAKKVLNAANTASNVASGVSAVKSVASAKPTPPPAPPSAG